MILQAFYHEEPDAAEIPVHMSHARTACDAVPAHATLWPGGTAPTEERISPRGRVTAQEVTIEHTHSEVGPDQTAGRRR